MFHRWDSIDYYMHLIQDLLGIFTYLQYRKYKTINYQFLDVLLTPCKTIRIIGGKQVSNQSFSNIIKTFMKIYLELLKQIDKLKS